VAQIKYKLKLCFGQALERWTSEHPYRYFNQETPQGTLEDAWEKCNEVLEGHDENICKDLKDEITFLMVVVRKIETIPWYNVCFISS
jgi:hypothetical protein